MATVMKGHLLGTFNGWVRKACPSYEFDSNSDVYNMYLHPLMTSNLILSSKE